MFKSDTPLARLLGTLLDQIIVNITFLVCCIPVVTIGPALCALYAVEFKIHKGDEGGFFLTFFKEFKNSLRCSLLCELFVVLLAAAIVGFAFLFKYLSIINLLPIRLLLAICVFVFAAMNLWLYPLISRFDEKWYKTLKNSVILAFTNIPTTVVAFIPRVLFFLIFLILPEEALMTYTGFLIFFAPVLTAWFDAWVIGKVFKKYAPDDSEQ